MVEFQPIVLLLKGHPGTGKTSIGRAIASKLRWPVADKDDVLNCLSQVMHFKSIDFNQLAYDVMFKVAETQLQIGFSVIIDCPSAKPELYETARDLAGKHNASLVLVECVPGDEKLWKQRLEARGSAEEGSCSAHKPASWRELQDLLKRYDGCWKWSTNGSVIIPHHIVLDTTVLDTTEACQDVIRALVQASLLPGTVYESS